MTSTPLDAVVVPKKYRKDPLVCAHCGHVNWHRAPSLRKAYEVIVAKGSVTTADVARLCKCQIPNATDRITRLVKLGLVFLTSSENHPTGGRINTYAPVPDRLARESA